MRSLFSDFSDLSQPKNVTVISATHGVNEFFSIALPPIIPFLVTDLDITYAQAGLLLSVFFVMYSIFQLPAGVLADRFGKKRLLVVGLLGMVVGIGLAAFAQNYEMLVLAQIIAGVGGSTYHPTGMSLISDIETESTEGKAMGVFGFGGMAGVATSPLLVGGLAEVVGWRLALAAAAVLGLVFTGVFVLTFSNPDDERDATPAPESVRRDGGEPRSLLERVRNALRFPFTMSILLLLFITLLVSLQTRAIMTFTTTYVFTGTGLSVSVANLVFFAMLIAGSLSSLGAGTLADRFDRGRLGAIVAIVTAALLVVTALVVDVTAPLPDLAVLTLLLAVFFVVGLAMYACVPVKNALVSEQADQAFSGSLFGVVQTSSAVGSATGPAIFGFLASEIGMMVAYPLIAVTSVLIAGAFVLLSNE